MSQIFIKQSFAVDPNEKGVAMSVIGCSASEPRDAFIRSIVSELSDEEKEKTIILDGESFEIDLSESDRKLVDVYRSNSCDALAARLKDSQKRYATILVRGLDSLSCKGLRGMPGTFGQVGHAVGMISKAVAEQDVRILFTTSTRSDKVTVSGPVGILRVFGSVLLLREKATKRGSTYVFSRIDRDSIADDRSQRRLVLNEGLKIDSSGRLVVS